ncbi:hypothetical protein C6495_18875 [Candidatus Poribacteria bacterium]|nr:MAG: hypothetical protein C6495_18875 [Candidatus Poribacteria bacterium]
MKQTFCLMLMLLLAIGCVNTLFAQTLMSDEFDGTGQTLKSFWQVKDSEKSPWELKDGLLVAEAGFDQNLWGDDTTTRFYQITDQDEFDIETSMVVDYADACTVAGIVVYSATTKDSQDRDGEWVTLKLWGRGAAQNNNAVLQYQRRQNDAAPYVGTQADYNPEQGVIPIELRIKREGDEYESWFKPNAEGDWVSVSKVTNALQEPLEVGIYVGICEGEGPGRMTVTFDYFREASSPATPVDPRDRLAVTWGELKRY